MKLFGPRFNQRLGSEDVPLKRNPVRRYASCPCLDAQYNSHRFPALKLHAEFQDITSNAWRSLEQYIDDVRAKGSEELDPLDALGPDTYEQILTLPPSVASLKSVKYLNFYGSHLVRLPPEIGELTNLEEFDVYTSYRLHWFPYEIKRCTKLKQSRISTRALYGNYKYGPPFPQLPQLLPEVIPQGCSVCHKPFPPVGPLQVWISLVVATDVMPLLVNACSEECVDHLPHPPANYVPEPHRGGLKIQQPPMLG